MKIHEKRHLARGGTQWSRFSDTLRKPNPAMVPAGLLGSAAQWYLKMCLLCPHRACSHAESRAGLARMAAQLQRIQWEEAPRLQGKRTVGPFSSIPLQQVPDPPSTHACRLFALPLANSCRCSPFGGLPRANAASCMARLARQRLLFLPQIPVSLSSVHG